MLRAQAMIFAMFAREPPEPTMGIPQTGFTPTGAVAGLAETVVKVEGECVCNLKKNEIE